MKDFTTKQGNTLPLLSEFEQTHKTFQTALDDPEKNSFAPL